MAHANRIYLWLAALAFSGCGKNSGEVSSSTSHWVECSVDSDCAGVAGAIDCNGGYCVDAAGERVAESDTSTAEGGGSATGGGGESATSAGSGGTGDGGAATSGTSGSSGTSGGSLSDPGGAGGNSSSRAGGAGDGGMSSSAAGAETGGAASAVACFRCDDANIPLCPANFDATAECRFTTSECCDAEGQRWTCFCGDNACSPWGQDCPPPAGTEDPCVGMPLNCNALCEGGLCECDCSGAGNGCDTPGWTSTTLDWGAFNLASQEGTGVTLCHPDSYAWTDPQPAANQPELNGMVTMRLLAYGQFDEGGALTYVSSQDTAQCVYEPNEMYGVRFPVIGGWPALEQSYIAPAPICGECQPPTEDTRLAYGSVYVAAGTNAVQIQASSLTTESLVELFEIAQTIRVDNGQTPTDPSVGIARLTELHQDGCQ